MEVGRKVSRELACGKEEMPRVLGVVCIMNLTCRSCKA